MTLRTWISPLLALTFATVANAAPVQYQITATSSGGEISWDGGTQFTFPSDRLFDYATTASAAFFYDSTTPATSTNNPPISQSFGANSYYTNSVTNLSGSVLGLPFSAESGDTLVSDSLYPPTSWTGITFNVFGTVASADSPAYNNFQGFALGDFTLVGASIMTASPVWSQSLPGQLSGDYVQLGLSFKNSTGDYRIVDFFGSGTLITPVPLPSAFLLFLSGLAGLGANAYRKFKR